MPESTYTPGVCNIDRVGVRRRELEGKISLFVGVIVLSIMYYFRVAPLYRYLAAFGFAIGTFTGFVQAKNKFCVVNGGLGFYEAGGKRLPINDLEAKKKDKLRTIKELSKITVYSLLAGLLGLLPI